MVVGGSLTRLAMRSVNIETVEPAEVLKLITMPLCCNGISDLVLGSFLLFAMRTLERWWGSRKFASYVVVTSSLALSLHILLFKATSHASLRFVRPGPASFVFALLIRYVSDVPSSHVVSEKIFVYASALWYAWSLNDMAQVGMGITAGLLAASKRLPFRGILLPKKLSHIFAPIAELLETKTETASPGDIMAALHGQSQQTGPYQDQLLPGEGEWDYGQFGGHAGFARATAGPGVGGAGGGVGGGVGNNLRYRGNAADGDGVGGGGGGGGGGGADFDPRPPAAIPEESVQALTDMGFDETSVRAALEQTGGSVEGAVALLAQ